MKPYRSSRYLASQLGMPLSELIQLAKDAPRHYHVWSQHNAEKNKTRIFEVPDEKLKSVQRRILRCVLAEYALSDSAHGGVPGRSPSTNAARHVGKPILVNLDIRDFFPSVDHRRVASMFVEQFGCGRQSAWLLTRLTTVNGHIPQGSPTSTAIANLLLSSPVDGPIERAAADSRVTYTRFVDDVAFSGNDAPELIEDTAKAISRTGLSTWRNRRKLKITPRSRRQEVTGLTVNAAGGPSVSRAKRSRIRSAIHQLKSMTPAEVENELPSIEGRISHLHQFNPGSARRLERQLRTTLAAIDIDQPR